MRTGLDAPTESMSADEVDAIRSFLDSQARIDLAVWVRHEQHGGEGPLYDHHLMLGVPDSDYASGDMWALENGIELTLRQPGWLDIFPLSEVEELRRYGTVVWERGARARTGDGLDFHFSWEPLAVRDEIVAAFAGLVRMIEGVERIEGALERLWQGGVEIRQAVRLYLDFRFRHPHDFKQIESAAREAGLTAPNMSMSAGRPTLPEIRTSTLYEAQR